MLTRRPLVGSLYVEPPHGRLQEVIVIARHGLVRELVEFIVGQASHARGRAAASEHGEGVSIMAAERNGDLGVFGCHWSFSKLEAIHITRTRRA